jgi:hypothetical protein
MTAHPSAVRNPTWCLTLGTDKGQDRADINMRSGA